MAANATGANIATQTGEGAAYVLHWDNFDAAMRNIYQQDLVNRKAIQAEFNQLSMKMGESGSKLRPVDMPAAQNLYNQFKQASLMLQSGKVRSNASQQAYWKQQQDNAYFQYMSLANRSADATKFLHETWQGIAAHPNNYYDFGRLSSINDVYNKSTVDDLDKLGLNTPVPWMHPADAYPADKLDEHILGKPITAPGKPEYVNDAATGIQKGWFNTSQQIYPQAGNAAQIASRVASALSSVYSAAKDWDQRYEMDMQSQPDVVKSTIDKANQILAADPGNKGRQLSGGYVDYATANYIVKSQPTPIGEKSWVTDPSYTNFMRDVNRKEGENFQLKKAGIEHNYRLDEMKQRLWQTLKTQNGISFNGDEMYDAANNPNQMYSINEGGKKITMQGYQLLDKRLSEIAGKIPKPINYVILNRANILDEQQRRRIISLLPDNTRGGSFRRGLYDLKVPKAGPTQGQRDQFVKAFVDELNRAGINVTMDDINTTATPVIINQQTGNFEVLPPKAYNYDQFVSQIAQMALQSKPKASTTTESGSILDLLKDYTSGSPKQ